MSDDPRDAELLAARARIARLEQEAETNRAFFARALAQANEVPRRGTGPSVWHALTLCIGFAGGVLLTVALVVARGQPPRAVPLPPVKMTTTPVVMPGLRDAGPVVVAAVDAGTVAGSPAPPFTRPPQRPDDSGTLNITASSPAVVFVDGKRVSPAPVHAFSVRPGEHVIRVACASDAGLEAERKVNVPPFAEVDVEHRCE